MDETPIRILHLSDFHFQAKSAWDSDPVLRGLAEIVGKIGRDGLTADYVAITGDIAYSGVGDEYHHARRWIEDCLLPNLPKGFLRDRILLVPGNHDVQRAIVEGDADLQKDQACLIEQADQRRIARILDDSDRRERFLKRHEEYLRFAQECGCGDRESWQPWWHREFDGICFVGLCSSWMSWSDADKSRLLIGLYQLNQAMAGADAQRALIILMHHGLAYLPDFDAGDVDEVVRNQAKGHLKIVLRGHLHKNDQRCSHEAGYLELVGGTAYDGSNYPNGFQMVEVFSASREVRVHFWTWHDRAWRPDNNATVNLKGNTATYLLGTALRLEDPQTRIDRAMRRMDGDLPLLDPYARSTQLVGREGDLKELEAWAKGPKVIAVRTLTGRAGAGKTRLSLELIDRIRKSAGGDQWHMGFLTPQEMEDFCNRQKLSDWVWPKPTLVVVDYAAHVARPLREWLTRLAANPAVGRTAGKNQPPLRILLLERHALVQAGWLAELMPKGRSEAGISELFDPKEPHEVSPITSGEDRRAIFENMLQLCAQRHSILPSAVPRLPTAGQDPGFDRRLAGEQWREPLYLMMAAAVAVDRARKDPRAAVPEALALSRTDLAQEIAKHEIDRVDRQANSFMYARENKPPLLLLAGSATLARGLDRDAALDVAEAVLEVLHRSYGNGAGQLVDDLAVVLPSTAGGITAVGPDIVGEAFAYLILNGPACSLSQKQQEQLLLAASKRLGANLFKSLFLLAQDFAVIWPATLTWIDALARAGAQGDLVILEGLAAGLPRSTVVLRERAAEIQSTLADKAQALADTEPSETNLARLAKNIDNLGNRLGDLGRREGALAATQKAVAIYQRLAAFRPDEFEPDLAISLTNLGIRFSDLGWRQKGLAALEESVNIYRRLAAQQPTYEEGLANSLSNMGFCLSELGQRKQALAATQESVDRFRGLALQQPDKYEPYLAMSLHCLSIDFFEGNQLDKALAAAQESAVIYRRLAAQWPDSFEPGLGAALSNVALQTSDKGRIEEAMSAAREAVAIFRRLAAEYPDAFVERLAESHWAERCCHKVLGHNKQAKDCTEEALTVLAPALQRLSWTFTRRLADICNGYQSDVESLGEQPRTKLLGPAVARLRELSDEGPGPGRDDAVS